MSLPAADLPNTAPGAARSHARVAGAIVWSGFLSAALGTMVCFAFVDPAAMAAGEVPPWWSSRPRVYAIGFFFFWVVGFIAAGLSWLLSRTAEAPAR
jgi:hypothetical protein